MSSDELNRFNLNGYELSSVYARQKYRNGGVLIMSKLGLKWKQVNYGKIELLKEEKLFEFCCSKCTIDREDILVVGIYRSPSSDVKEFLNRLGMLFEFLLSINRKFVIAGDLNINILESNTNSKDFKNLLKSYGLNFLVDFPTRVTAVSETAIDNILTNISINELKITGIITELSDHDGQILEINFFKNLLKNKHIFKKTRHFSNENLNLFYKMLQKESLNEVYLASVEQKYNLFHDRLMHYFNLCFEKKYV